jgi:signal transduction histidine kinase
MSGSEQDRLAALRSYRVLDTPREEAFDQVVQLAADLFDAPMAAMSLVDTDRQWFKAEVGLGVRETPRAWAFCSHTIEQCDGVLVVEDADKDARFHANPLVTGSPHIRFYAGVALTGTGGHKLGSLCVIDTKPVSPSRSMLAQLKILSKLAVGELELAKARAKLAEKQQLLELAERMSGVGHWRFDVVTGKIDWSSEVYRVHGVQPETFNPGLDDAISFFYQEDQQKIRMCVTDAIASGEGYEFASRLLGRDGVTRNVTSKAVCETDATGKVTALFGVFQDVTAHRQALDGANAATAVKAEFLANMSHELRTPLTSIIGFAELLRMQTDLSEKSSGFVDRVVNGSQALLATVNDVLDFSKLEAGQVELRPRPTATRRAFADAVDLFAPQTDARGVSLCLDVSPAVPGALLFDPDRLRQVLLNLIGNAAKFTASGSITVQVDYERPQTLVFAVEDSGPGMDEEQVSHLFKRFSQVDGSLSRAHGGTGLGLAICKGLVEAMGGEIGVTSVLDKGSVFRVSLPCPSADLAGSETPPLSTALSLDAYRVLVVDDNESNRALVAASLKSTGVELAIASDGHEGVEMAARAPYDLILMDMHMPSMDGSTAVAMIRKGAGPNRGIPIMAFTADADGGQMVHLRDAGFDGVIPKPILPSALVRQIFELLTGQKFIEPSKAVRHA